MLFGGTSFVTTLPAPTSAFSPIVMFDRMVLPEPIDAPLRVEQLLLPGEEGVALGTHLDPDLRLGGPGVNDLATVARNRGVDVFGMNASLHGPPPG